MRFTSAFFGVRGGCTVDGVVVVCLVAGGAAASHPWGVARLAPACLLVSPGSCRCQGGELVPWPWRGFGPRVAVVGDSDGCVSCVCLRACVVVALSDTECGVAPGAASSLPARMLSSPCPLPLCSHQAPWCCRASVVVRCVARRVSSASPSGIRCSALARHTFGVGGGVGRWSGSVRPSHVGVACAPVSRALAVIPARVQDLSGGLVWRCSWCSASSPGRGLCVSSSVLPASVGVGGSRFMLSHVWSRGS